jgi:glycerol-3-phosphate acyltransferase PlsY
MLNLFLMILLSYVVGSIPTSIIASKLLKGIDIRKHGSGNAGATNVFRVMGWKIGLSVLLIDMAKGYIPTVLFYKLGMKGVEWPIINLQILAGLSAIFGHIWTMFAGFKGGKGVGTGAGMLIGLTPFAVLIGIIIFAIVVSISRFVSLGSILASISVPVTVYLQSQSANSFPVQLFILSLFVPALIIYTHRKNIQRLLKGEESKIQFVRSKNNNTT